jgi:hypothetical protein
MQFVPHKTHGISIKKSDWWMLFWEIIDSYSKNDMKHVNPIYEQNAELRNVILYVTYNYSCPLKGHVTETWIKHFDLVSYLVLFVYSL